MIYNGVLDLVGNTPILKLNNLSDEDSAEVYVKLENIILVEVLRIGLLWND